MIKFPIINVKNVYHIGTMNHQDKTKNSLEGAGLSISNEPEAWCKIARLGGHDTFELIKSNNQFLNIHELSDAQRTVILNYGVENGLISPAKLFEVSYFDDEMDDTVFSIYESYQEAQIEAEELDIEPVAIDGHIATETLKHLVNGDAHPLLVFDLLCTIYAVDVLNIDGVWWNDILDVFCYSAPRGVISTTKLPSWQINKVKKQKRL